MNHNSSTRLVHLASYASDAQAHIVQGMLDSNGIPSVLNGEIISGVMGIQLLPNDSIRLMVRECDADRALQLLAEHGDDNQSF